MRYPVDVYTGKIQAYPEGKPSAIAKIQVDGGVDADGPGAGR